MLNFGIVDRLVFLLLEGMQPSGVSETQREQNLNQRWEKLLELLPAHAETEEWRAKLEVQTEALTQLRQMRNGLAHGVLLATVGDDWKSVTSRVVQAKDWDRANQPGVWSLSYKQLVHACQQLNTLIDALQALAGFQES